MPISAAQCMRREDGEMGGKLKNRQHIPLDSATDGCSTSGTRNIKRISTTRNRLGKQQFF